LLRGARRVDRRRPAGERSVQRSSALPEEERVRAGPEQRRLPRAQADRLISSDGSGRKVANSTPIPAGASRRQRTLARTCSPRPCGKSMTATRSEALSGTCTLKKAPPGQMFSVVATISWSPSRSRAGSRTSRRAYFLRVSNGSAPQGSTKTISACRGMPSTFRKGSATTRCDTLTECDIRPTPRYMAQQNAVPEGPRRTVERGRYYEDFKVGDVYPHHWGRTITDGEAQLFATATMNAVPLYFNRLHAQALGHHTPPVHPLLVMNVVFG